MSDVDVLARGIGTTVLLTVCGFGLGSVLAIPLALARRSRALLLRAPARGFVELVRGVPPIAWLFLIFFGLAQQSGIRLTVIPAAIIGLGAIAGAYLSEIFRAALGAVPRGQFEAARAVGFGELAVYRSVVIPQAVRIAIPAAATYAIGLLKESAIASTIGAQDVTFQAFQLSQENAGAMTVFVMAGLIYMALSAPLAIASRWLDARLTRRLAR